MTPDKLREIPLFATLSEDDTAYLLRQSVQKKYAANTIIFWMDEPGDRLFIIEKGEVGISHASKDGKERMLAVLGEGDFFGELSLIDGGAHTATARAMEDTVVLTISQSVFYNFLEIHPDFSRTLLTVLTDRLRKSDTTLRNADGGKPHPVRKERTFKIFVDHMAGYIATSRFLLIAITFLLGWIIVQTILYKQHSRVPIHFIDAPPTFFILGFILTFFSFIINILVLTSQRRLAEQDRLDAEIEYQVNLKAQSEIMRLQLKMNEVLKLLEDKEKTKEEKLPDNHE